MPGIRSGWIVPAQESTDADRLDESPRRCDPSSEGAAIHSDWPDTAFSRDRRFGAVPSPAGFRVSDIRRGRIELVKAAGHSSCMSPRRP